MSQHSTSSSAPLSVLAGSRIFRGLDEAALTAVLQESTIRNVPAGGFFFHEGDPANTFFVVISGAVRLLQTTSEGKQVIMHLATPSQEMAVIAMSDRDICPVSAEAVKDSSAYAWSSTDLQRLMKLYPPIAFNSGDMVIHRLRKAQNMYRELATERVEQRVARTIMRLAGQAGVETESGIRIDMPLTREAIAQMTGTTLYTVSRVLTKWEHAGLVNIGRQFVEILSQEGMMDIVENHKE